MTNHPIVEYELQQILTTIPEIRWIRIIHIDGLTHPRYRFNAGDIKRDTDLDLEEDRFGAMSVAALSLAERVSALLVLGNSFLSVIEAEIGTHFFLPLDDGTEWFISFVVKGRPDITATLKYFKDRDNLAHITPYLATR